MQHYNASLLIFLAERVIETAYGIGYLRKKLAAKSNRVALRYGYYDMKHSVQEFKGIIPEQFRFIAYSLGWCAKAVDVLADRLQFDRFEHDDFLLNEIFALNNRDILFGSANLSALISACSFLYIGRGANGFPTIQVIDGGSATARQSGSSSSRAWHRLLSR